MPLLTLSLIVLALAQFLDLATFAMMVHRLGPAAEANPVVADILRQHGVSLAAVAKFALVALVTSIAVILWTRDRPHGSKRLAVLVVAVGIVIGIFGGWTNSVTLGPF